MKRWKWALRAGATLMGATAAVGVLHLPAARPLLALLAKCPVGLASPVEIEEAQSIALRTLRGSEAAPSRPALGFTLETTTREEVRAWARARGIACKSAREETLLTCIRIPAPMLGSAAPGPIDEVAFGFRVRDRRLVNVTTLSSGLVPADAAGAFTTVAARLTTDLGDPAAARMPAPHWDGSGPAFVRYRFADYIADLNAMALPGRGVVLREHYMAGGI